jgi:hypothetical protein
MSDIYSLSISLPVVNIGTLGAGTVRTPIMKLPGTVGGGITLLGGAYSSETAIAAGSAPMFNLVTLTSTGAVIATIGANGSAALSAGTPVAATITTYWIPGTVAYLAVEAGHGAYGAASMVAYQVHLTYAFGRGNS